MRYIITIIIATILSLSLAPAAPRKEIKDLKQYVKTSNIGKGREIINRCINDTTINNDPELYALAIALEKKALASENEKLYLKQKYDTAAFFSTTYRIFEHTLSQQRAEKAQGHELKPQGKKQRADMLRNYYPNLYNGGVYFVKKQNWNEADKLLTAYITLPQDPLYLGQESPIDSVKLPRAAFMSMRACYEAKRYADVFKFQQQAEADSANLEFVLQYDALSRQQLGDNTLYVASLCRGLQLSSNPQFYFSRLIDYYGTNQDYKAALQLCDSIMQHDPANALYAYARVVTLYNLKFYNQCATQALRLKELDPSNPLADYYAGISYFNEGENFKATITPNLASIQYKRALESVKQYYFKACPYLERYRRLCPDDKELWYAPLCKIYFNLNMGAELKELENMK